MIRNFCWIIADDFNLIKSVIVYFKVFFIRINANFNGAMWSHFHSYILFASLSCNCNDSISNNGGEQD